MNLSEWVLAFTWSDALDFLILYLVCYGALSLVRGTRAAPVLLSFVFFAVAGFLARTLELVALATVLKYVLEYAVLILIIVFHQELRRILVRIGQRLIPLGRRGFAANAVQELMAALGELKEARVGAIIVLEGEIDVVMVCGESGQAVDARLDACTLVAFAAPHHINTAHDGAIVVRDFRVHRVGVIGPLSDKTVDHRFGTRHRSALGISEESDAFVMVLSEERGELRIAERGELSSPLNPSEIESKIQAWLQQLHVQSDSEKAGSKEEKEKTASSPVSPMAQNSENLGP